MVKILFYLPLNVEKECVLMIIQPTVLLMVTIVAILFLVGPFFQVIKRNFC